MREKRGAPEFRNLPERENVKEAVRPLVRRATKAPAQVKPTPHTAQQRTISREDALPEYAKDADEKTQERVERCLALVFSDGIEKAAREAGRSDPFSIDAFHDALTDKLCDELKKRGIL